MIQQQFLQLWWTKGCGGVAATFWALSNVHVETDAQSYDQHVARAVSWERKEKKYAQETEVRQASFYLFVPWVDGLMAWGAWFIIKCFDDRLSSKWGKSYGEVIVWVQTRLSFAILQAISNCMHMQIKSEMEGNLRGEWCHSHALDCTYTTIFPSYNKIVVFYDCVYCVFFSTSVGPISSSPLSFPTLESSCILCMHDV